MASITNSREGEGKEKLFLKQETPHFHNTLDTHMVLLASLGFPSWGEQRFLGDHRPGYALKVLGWGEKQRLWNQARAEFEFRLFHL